MTEQDRGQATPVVSTPEQITPFGPDSLLWKYLGDWRYYLMAPAGGMLQAMDPAVDAALRQHSAFFAEPWARVLRSIPQIVGPIYDADGAQSAAKVRDYHRDVKGIDHHGRRYHALNPDVYFWTHATFIWAVVTMVDAFDHRTSDDEKQRLYAEGKQWYRLYGLSERPMPEDWYAFRAYFERMCAEMLENTESAAWIVSQFLDPVDFRPPGIPDLAWRLLGPLFTHEFLLLTTGMLPPAARQKLGLSWTRKDRRRFRRRMALIRAAWPLLPVEVRYTPRALEGIRRVAQAEAATETTATEATATQPQPVA